jgi:hypothetical protein
MARSSIALAAALVALTMMGAGTASAERQLFLETHGGYNQSKITGDVPTVNKSGFVGGVAVHLPLQSHTSLQIEANYASKGGSYGTAANPVYQGTVYTGTYNQVYALDYLELPVMGRLTLSSGRIRPSLMAGPYVGWKVLEKAHLVSGNDGSTGIKADNYRRMDLGATAGVGLEIGPPERAATVEVRYSYGLTNALRPEYVQTVNNNDLRVTVGWKVAYPAIVDLH